VVERAVEPEFRGARHRLVEELRGKGIRDLAVLRAVEMTPRHLFVPTGIRHRAYDDAPLPIGNGQTISQPFIHAQYLEVLELKGTERVLEVGTGTGYQTALLSHLVAQVFSIERIASLSSQAREILKQLGLRNISLLVGDGTLGWRDHAPFDAILVSAGSPTVPQPLLDQLADGGRLLVPIGDRDVQQLVMYRRRGERIEKRDVAAVRFVPLIGTHGWDADEPGPGPRP
jgi:protein-L-isoaspartate(D-aspartate) O-methyltransferase